MDDSTIDISVIVPALEEAENIPELIRRLDAALNGKRYEVLIVDDNSRDNTSEVCAALAGNYPLRLLVRTHPKNGLSGAVLDGMALARGDIFIVMDADLQHPPEQAPALVTELEHGGDFAIGSRYTAGGSTQGGWGAFRKLNSGVATLLARPFAGRTTDPMSGFFALRRATYERAERLTPLGYKVALELMCKCRVRDVREVPIQFATRTRGESKLTMKQQFKYLEHLSRLYDFFFPHASPVGKFLIVTLLGWSVGLVAYQSLAAAGMNHVGAVTIGYLCNVLLAAMFHNRYVRTQREFLATQHPWIEFSVTSLAELMSCALVGWWSEARLANPKSFDLPILCFLAATLVRYVLRKELMQDIRGLRRDLRSMEWNVTSTRNTEGHKIRSEDSALPRC
jgi:dolichol-phosphate mannosyltransferase